MTPHPTARHRPHPAGPPTPPIPRDHGTPIYDELQAKYDAKHRFPSTAATPHAFITPEGHLHQLRPFRQPLDEQAAQQLAAELAAPAPAGDADTAIRGAGRFVYADPGPPTVEFPAARLIDAAELVSVDLVFDSEPLHQEEPPAAEPAGPAEITVEEIAGAFGVPLDLLGTPGGANYDTWIRAGWADIRAEAAASGINIPDPAADAPNPWFTRSLETAI